jgi:hypothetical protein
MNNINASTQKFKPCNQGYWCLFRLAFFCNLHVGVEWFDFLIIKYYLKKMLAHVTHVLVYGRYLLPLNGTCGIIHYLNTIFQNGVGRVSLWSFQWRCACSGRMSGWALVDFFSLFNLFFSYNLIFILFIAIWIVLILILINLFFQFHPSSFRLILFKFQIWLLFFWFLFVCFYRLSNWILFLIPLFNILYQIIFILNLVLTLLIIISFVLKGFFFVFFFNFII